MRDEHIITVIENAALAHLTEEDRALIREHTSACSECRRAYEAAQLSTLLLKARSAETLEPPPFFQTRVLAMIREREATSIERWGLRRLWSAAGALASGMVATVATLAVLTFVSPAGQSDFGSQEVSSALNGYSAEYVILNQNSLPDQQVSDGQVLNTLYQPEEDR